MKIVESCMKRPVTVTMVTLAAVLFGFVSLSRLPLNLLPEISYPTLTIRTAYPDAAPAEVEKLITEPLEEAVSVIQGLRSLRSVSRAGVSEITMEFAWKTGMDYSALDVREKIDLVDLPEDAGMPVLLRYDPSLDPILRVGLFGEKDLVTLRHLADKVLKKDLESLEGVASVRVRGGLEEEIHVEIDEGKLASLDIPISAVGRFLDGQNVNAAGGHLRDREAEFLVRTVNEFEDMEDIRNAVLYQEDGRRVLMEDVADITRGFKERDMISRVQGEEAVELALYKEGHANTVRVARSVKNRIAAMEESLPEGVGIRVLFDQSTFIEQSLGEVRSNAITGGLLAILILFLFLRERRSTTIIGLVIPLSILATFFVMQQLNVSLNIMSLGGLALGVGMLVDNAIVVLEAINRHRSLGKSVWNATLEGATEVSRAVTASTLTTVAVFLPIVFVEGIAGQIFRDQALTVASSLLVSLIAALTLIPVLSVIGQRRGESGAAPAASQSVEKTPVVPDSAVSPDDDGGEAGSPPRWKKLFLALAFPFVKIGRGFWFLFRYPWRYLLLPILKVLRFLLVWIGRTLVVFIPGLLIKGVRYLNRYLSFGLSILFRPVQAIFDRTWSAFADSYPRVLGAVLKHRSRALVPALLLTAAAVFLLPRLGVELVPPFSQGEFSFEIEMPPGTPLNASERKIIEIERDLVDDARIKTLFSSVGESPELGNAAVERRENIARINLAIQNPENHNEERQVVEMVRNRLEREPGIHYTYRRPTYFSYKTPIEVHVFGYDIEGMSTYSAELASRLAGIDGLRDVRNSLEEGNPEVQIVFQRDRLAHFGLDLESVSRTLRNKIHGEVATRLKERDRQIDILVRSARAEEIQVNEVKNLVVSQMEGVPIPLSSVADVTVGHGPARITHIGQQRAAVIEANLAGRDLGSASRDIEEMLRRTPTPPMFSASLGGQNREVSTSFRSLALAVCLAVFMVYLVMASQFESFVHPLVILATVPLGMVGTVFALAMTGTSVSIVVLIGVVMLTGIVVNNAIVLVDFINQRRRAGMEKVAAVLEAGRARFRPIFMTTTTTVLALTPMALGFGQGAELRAPMAIAVIGGLILGTVLTLIVIPVVYVTVDRKP